MPIAYTLTNLFSMGVQFMALIFIYIYYLATGYHFTPTLWLMVVPLLVIQLGMLSAGVGITVSSLTTKYRDLKQLLGFGISLWMYATPIIYPLSKVPGRWRWLYQINPISSVIETFRYALLGKGTLDIGALEVSVFVTIMIFLAGIIIFNHNERTFIDVV